MTINREFISDIYNTIQLLKNNQEIDLINKYYILKIEKIIKEELLLTQQLFDDISSQYGEQTEQGIKIKDEYLELVAQQIKDFNNTKITFPDISFPIEIFESSNLSWSQLESMMPFIKT